MAELDIATTTLESKEVAMAKLHARAPKREQEGAGI